MSNTANSIASRLDHYRWTDGSVTPGTPVQNYAQACAVYERRRRAYLPTARVRLRAADDGLGFVVDDSFCGSFCRATPGNVYPHPGNVEYQG